MYDTTTTDRGINYAEDFRYNEMLHATAQSTLNIYMRLRRENPTHPDHDMWTEKMKLWSKYDRDEIRQLFFTTEAEAKSEVAKVVAANHEATAIQSALKKND